MQFDELVRRLKQPNALQLLREPNAALMLVFLKTSFAEGRKTIPQEELVQALAEFLPSTGMSPETMGEDMDRTDADLFDYYRERAKKMVRDWESVKKRYIRGDNNIEGRYEYALTEHVVRAWQWIDSLETREFTGTRSRLDDIFEKIRRVVENAQEKTDAERIAELEQKQRDLEAEINAIRAGKSPYKPFDNVRLREEYDGLLEQIRALSTDFKAVEGHFERIRSEMLRQQAARQGSKGMLLGATLDARDALDRTPQGLSFNAFFEELRNPQRQQQFVLFVEELLRVLHSRQIEHPQAQLLQRVYRHLLAEAQPVLEANRRIADRISRIVAENAALDRQLLRQRLAEVKAALLDPQFLQKNLDSSLPFWTIEADKAAVSLPLEKNLRTQSEERSQNFVQPQSAEVEKPALVLTADASIVLRLESQINAALSEMDVATLADLAQQYPISEGLAEVLVYLNIAAQPVNRHFIDADKTDSVLLNEQQNHYVEGPRVFYLANDKKE